MPHEKIEQARSKYKKGKISFLRLDKIFWEYATDEEVNAFYNATVYDRPSIIEGKSKLQIDSEWTSLVESFD